MSKQNELIRTLQKQLAATERELANQKWLLDQYLKSPSWRLTAPLRWLARRFRAIVALLFGTEKTDAQPTPIQETVSDLSDAADPVGTLAEFKHLYSDLHRGALKAFLSSNAGLQLPTSPEPVVSIILILFNRAELTFACLRSILETAGPEIEVIIVDNASSDDTPHLLASLDGPRIIRNTENRNFLLAVNQAAKHARGKYLLLLNNDVQLLPGTLQTAIDTIASGEDIGAVGARIVLLNGTLQEAGSIIWRNGSCLGYGRGDNPFSSAYMFRRDVDYCSGAFLLTPRAVWEKLGGFDEIFSPAYYEETDYCMRLRESGLRVVYEPQAVILHYEFASSASNVAAIELQAAHQQIFAKRHALSLQNHLMPSLDSVLLARTRRSGKRILFVDDRVPHPWLGSGFPRTRTMLLALVKHGFFVTLFPMAVLDEEWSAVYSDMPREIEVMNQMGPPLLEAFLRNRRDYYDVIVISRPHNMNYLRPTVFAHPEWFEKTAIVYDAEALFAPRDVALRQLHGEQLDAETIEKVYTDEISLASVADCVMAVSELDRAAFASHGIQGVHIVGHALDTVSTHKPFHQRTGFLFVGAVHDEWSPNGDSLVWFLTEIWPQIRAQLGNSAMLTIAGINKSDRVRQLSGTEVRILGHMEDISPLYEQARVFIAPTRLAAGIPHKVHEAAAHGVPVVATSLLARQLQWEDGIELHIADTPEAFARQCLSLYENETEWIRIRENALKAIRRDCSRASFEKQLDEILSAITTSRNGRFSSASINRSRIMEKLS